MQRGAKKVAKVQLWAFLLTLSKLSGPIFAAQLQYLAHYTALFSTSADPVLHIWPNIFGPYLAENYQVTGKVLKNKQAHISEHRERV